MRGNASELLVKMVETYSPTGQETDLAGLLLNRMQRLGFTAEIDEVGNVIGRIGEGRPRVLLCGHMDTVPGFIPVKVEDEVLYGRGAVDAKAPLAAMIVAAEELSRDGYKGQIIVVGAVDEEGKGTGIKQLVNDGLDIDFAVFGEPTNVDTITVGYRGSLLLKITCMTETGHASAPWLFENSIEKAFEVWNLIKGYTAEHENPESRFNSLSSCLRRIEGGETASIVPPRCDMHIEIRIPPSLTVKTVTDEVIGLIKEYKVKNPAVTIEVNTEDFTEPYVADRHSPLVRAFSHAILRVRGTRTKLIYKTGTGDMNIFGSSLQSAHNHLWTW